MVDAVSAAVVVVVVSMVVVVVIVVVVVLVVSMVVVVVVVLGDVAAAVGVVAVEGDVAVVVDVAVDAAGAKPNNFISTSSLTFPWLCGPLSRRATTMTTRMRMTQVNPKVVLRMKQPIFLEAAHCQM